MLSVCECVCVRSTGTLSSSLIFPPCFLLVFYIFFVKQRLIVFQAEFDMY